ncbi:MAG: GNAT family protein [Xanthobacteraceae bacterium]
MKLSRRRLPDIIIETDRFVIRNIRPWRFARQTVGWSRDVEMMVNMGWGTAERSLYDWWRLLRKLERGDRRCLGIWARGETRPIGLRWIQHYSRANVGMLNALIGDKSWRGRGAYAETTKATIDYWFSNTGVERLYAQTRQTNAAVIHTLERLGFRHEGTLRSHAMTSDGTRIDMIQFGLLRGEWLARRKGARE